MFQRRVRRRLHTIEECRAGADLFIVTVLFPRVSMAWAFQFFVYFFFLLLYGPFHVRNETLTTSFNHRAQKAVKNARFISSSTHELLSF